MAYSWTHTVEERLRRLEQAQEELAREVAALQAAVRGTDPVPPLAPMAGGQGTPAALGLWTPGRGGTMRTRDHRRRVMQRVESLSAAVRALRESAQRLESMCTLLGHCVCLAVDPEHTPSLPNGTGGNGGAGESAGGQQGIWQAVTQLLPALQGSAAQGEGRPAASPAPEGERPAGDDGGTVTLHASQGVAALLPLIQAVLARQGGSEVGARLAALLSSPAMQDLLSRRST